ncbi:MAG TPA: hypothetical protein VK875_09570, partial [Euzebyales bacterium]|nr:hypothetical protein [Euzebyales bacterium]
MVVAGQLGLPSLDAAATAYSDASMVVVLDNCEHVLDAAAAVASTLLAAGTGVCVLTTSREPLGLPSERVVPIDVLEVPASDDPADVQRSPAARLFLARALASGAPITLDATTAAPIASVCRRLDGLPLALRLAAARSRTLTPTEIDRHLDDRFRLLASRQARGPERHRSQRAAIDWSYDLLDPDEQRFFDALGIFDDRFSADAARTVAALDDEPLLTVLSRLDDLVQRSLLTVVPSPLGSRYRLLESLREYARERLAGGGDLAATRQRYLDHLTQVATEIHAAFRAAWTPEPVLRLLIEYENLRAATEWCAANDATPHRAFTLFLPQFLAIDNARARPVAELGQRLLGRWPDPVDPLWPDMLAV